MHKTLRLALNKYSQVPRELRLAPSINTPKPTIEVDLAALYHHYFLDSFGTEPPDPDPAKFEHAQFLLPTPEFRFQGNGLGIAPAIRRHRSNELGQAFCRWFLSEFFDVVYFAHVEKLLSRQLQRPFEGCSLKRVAAGDSPDYLCATNHGSICLAEAKGRYSSISFKNKEFSSWREQFSRVEFKDSHGTTRSIKGHIVATRFATEENSERLKSSLFAEDPISPGDEPFNEENSWGLNQAVLSAHYANIAQKLRQPILAYALQSGTQISKELRVSGVAWEVVAGPYEGRRFIGGYYSVNDTHAQFSNHNERTYLRRYDPLRLDAPSFTFFGLEENIFQQVVQMARNSSGFPVHVESLEELQPFYSGFSLLRDGSVVAPLEFFRPVEQQEF